MGEGSIEPTQILVVLNWSCSRPLFRHRQDRRRRYGRGVSSTGHQARPGRGTEGAATKPNRYSRRGTLSADRAEGEPLLSQHRNQPTGGFNSVTSLSARVFMVPIVHHDDAAAR